MSDPIKEMEHSEHHTENTEETEQREEAQSSMRADGPPDPKKFKTDIGEDSSTEMQMHNEHPGISADSSGEIKKHDEGNTSESSPKQFAAFTMLSAFNELVENMPINIGTFEVVWVEYIPYGEKAGLTEPVMNIVFSDSHKHKSVFTAYGDHAKNWSHVEITQVLQLENFDWRKDAKNKSHFYGFTFSHCGYLNEQTSFIINEELSKIFGGYREHQIDHINSIGEIKDDHHRMVLMLDVKMQRELIRCKDQVRRARLFYLFSTSDEIEVEFTAFEKNCELMETLEEGKAYIIENVTPYENRAHPSHRLQFTVSAHTKFVATDFQKTSTPAQKISLLDVFSGKFTKDTIYEIEGFVRQKSVHFEAKHMSQCVIFDKSSTTDKTLSAMITFADSVQLLRGQQINFKFNITESHEKNVLNVVPGTLTVMPESFPDEEIGNMKFHVV